jgi:predicted RNA methylase
MKQYWSLTEGSFNCLIDRRRTLAFSRAIRNVVCRGNVVADLGSGSGIMALFAAKAGAKKVFAVEHDEKNAKWLEKTFSDNGYGNVIEVVQADARKVILPQKADVIICEMIATGLIEELQIPVMNQALLSAKKSTRVVLETFENYIEAVDIKDRFYGFRLPVPQYDYPDEHSVCLTPITRKKLYRAVDFTKKNLTDVNVTIQLPVLSSGITNGIRISNQTVFCDGSTFGYSFAYCYPIILPISPMTVKKGDKLLVKLAYDMCGGFSGLTLEVTKGGCIK